MISRLLLGILSILPFLTASNSHSSKGPIRCDFTDEYTTTNCSDSVVCSITYDYFIENFYDTNVRNSDVRITKRCIGKDSGGTDVLEYDFCPTGYKHTILISAGMNPNELTPIFALSYFLDRLIHPSSGISTFLHDSVRVKIIPILCPSAFDRPHKKYLSHNNVNINRNFDYNGSWASMDSHYGTWSYKGTRPMSEVESRLLAHWLASNQTANTYIDCHSAVGSNLQYTFYTYASDYATKTKVLEAQAIIKDTYSLMGLNPTKESVRVVKDGSEYPKIPLFYNQYGIPSIMIEQNPGDLTHGGTEMHNDKFDICNYVYMISLYSYYSLKEPNYIYFIRNIKARHFVTAAILLVMVTLLLVYKRRKHP